MKANIKAVENGLAIGAIWFHNNYSDSLDERLENSLDIDSVVIDESNLHLCSIILILCMETLSSYLYEKAFGNLCPIYLNLRI